MGLVVAVVVSATALAACGGASEGDSSENRRVVQIPIAKSEFMATVAHSARQEAAKLGWDYELQIPAAPDVESETATMNAVIASKPDAIFLEPVDRKAMVAPVNQAEAAGIKVLTYDSNIAEADLPDAFISTDYVEGGRQIAQELLRMTGEHGTYLHLLTWPGLAFSEDLQDGYEEVMSQTPGATQLPVGVTNGEPSKAASIVSAALSRTPDLAGTYVGTLPDQQGSLSALRSAGALGKVKTVAWDANPDTVKNLRAGIWDVIISTRAAEYGVRLVKTADALFEGEDVETEQLLDDCIITKENVDSQKVQPCIYLPLNG